MLLLCFIILSISGSLKWSACARSTTSWLVRGRRSFAMSLSSTSVRESGNWRNLEWRYVVRPSHRGCGWSGLHRDRCRFLRCTLFCNESLWWHVIGGARCFCLCHLGHSAGVKLRIFATPRDVPRTSYSKLPGMWRPFLTGYVTMCVRERKEDGSKYPLSYLLACFNTWNQIDPGFPNILDTCNVLFLWATFYRWCHF